MWVEVVLLALLLMLLKKALQKPAGLPPGYWGVPLLGYINPITRKGVEEQIIDLQKKHGDVTVWRMGKQVIIFLFDYHMTKEAYLKPEFTDRPDWKLFTVGEKPIAGVGATNGARWHNNRRFSLRQLRDLGMGKSKLVDAVHTQAKWLVEQLKKQTDKPAPVPHALNVAIVNVIWQMVGSQQFDINDIELKEFDDLFNEFIASFNNIAILDFMPWILIILPKSLAEWMFQGDIVERTKDKFVSYFEKVVGDHRSTLDPNNPRDLIDSYLVEMDQTQDDPACTMDERDLIFLLIDLFTAGSNTTKDTMTFLFYYLANNPKAQTKLQAEIDDVLGGALPNMDDRKRMGYTDAVIHEVLRMSSLAALGVQHVASADMVIGGYLIPKDSVLSSVTVSMHYDPRYWDNPHQFLPERWLDQDGHFIAKKDGFLPFGVGKRQCLGEALARMELFIFTVSVFQQLNFSAPPGKTVDPTHNPDMPIFHSPRKQDVFVTLRK